jgi:c-di-GMP-related signal transduction protein
MRARATTRKNRRRLPISKARLKEMIEQATVDAYSESEQITGWFTMIDENLAMPFETMVLGLPVTVERLDLNLSDYFNRDPVVHTWTYKLDRAA